MALVTCQECGEEVSTKAKACPKCGEKAPKKHQLQNECSRRYDRI